MKLEKNQNEETVYVEPLTVEPSDSILSENAMKDIAKTIKYMRIIFILCYVVFALLVLWVVVSMLSLALGVVTGYGITVVNVIVRLCGAVLSFIFGSYLHKTVNAYTQFIKSPNDVEQLESAISQQAGYWKLTGIFTLIILGVYLLSMLLFIIAT
jgi:predicted nucleic acid-binding Zn ribbon protein